MRSYLVTFLITYNKDSQVKEDKMGEACNTNKRDENWIQELSKCGGKRSFGRPTHTWEIVLNCSVRKCLVEMWACVQLTEDKSQ